MSDFVTLNEIKAANKYIFSAGTSSSSTSLVRRTPLISRRFHDKEIFLKMESLQNTGSFKIRGMTNCFRVHEKEIRKNGAVTLSAGNAGRSFAFLCGRLNVTSTVCM